MTDFFSCAARFFVFRFVVFFLSFILTEMSLLSADETPSGAVAMPPEKQLSIQFVNKIYIPEEIGIIKEVVIPDKDKITELVICIQDAHCNYEAQMNINKIVKLFVEDYGIKLVNVEGSTGVIDTSPFSAFKDRKVKMDFADYFMKQGKITGPEYLSITSDLNFIIFGIENEDLYARNYTAFMNVQEYRDRINAYSTKLLERLNKLKESIFSPELLEVDREVTKFDEKTIDFEVYARFLEETALKYKIDLSPFENFNLQTKARIIEKEIDFKKVEEQREELISRFNTTLQGDKDKLRNIVHQSLAYKLREIDAETYYSFILNAAKENNINMEDLSHIAKYADYLHYYNTIDKMRLLDECGEVERHIKKALYKNPLEAELDHLSRIVSLIRKLFKLEVVKSDYLFFKENKNEFSFRKAVDFIQKEGPKYNVFLGFDVDYSLVEKNLPSVLDFYEAAIKRDQILLDNAFARMKEEKLDRFILVTGGFHSDGLTNLLKKGKHPFLLIAPRIMDPNAPTPYLEIMKAQADSVKGYKRVE